MHGGTPNLTVTPCHVEPERKASRQAEEGHKSKLSIFTRYSSASARSSVAGSARSSSSDSERGSFLVLKSPRRPRRSGPPIWVTLPRFIVENTVFVTITTILTIYVLISDDMRLLLTERPADHAFDIVTFTAIVIFSIEVVLCTLGKDDYFLSFFFMLDVISTITMILDITRVSEMMQGDEEDLEQLRGSRTAKIGAKAGRVVRVIRLVRILKLYKAVVDARRARKEAKARKEARPSPILRSDTDDDDWEGIDVDDSPAHGLHESRVGKKLSDLTTRRVICLVLVMMLVLPLLRMDASQQFPTSATYGADIIYEAFQRLEDSNGSSRHRSGYEKSLLQYVYYHNWFNTQLDACPYDRLCSKLYSSQLFWVGIASGNAGTLAAKAQAAKVLNSTVRVWEEDIRRVLASDDSAWIYNYGTLPPQVQELLGRDWSLACPTESGKYRRLGVSLLELAIPGQVSYRVKCPENLRRVERKKYAPRLNVNVDTFEDWHFAFYFDLRPFVEKESIFSLVITVFVCLALSSASLLFSNDANTLVLYPVENMIAKVEMIRNNPLLATKVADEEFKAEEMHRARLRKQEQSKVQALLEALMCTRKESTNELMETVILEKTIIKLGSLLALGFGEAGSHIIAHNMRGVDSACVNAMVEGTRVECIIGATRIRDFSIATEVLQANVMTFVNRIAEIVHGVANEFHGAVNKNSGDTFLVIWRRSGMQESKVCKLADMAMLAFSRILGAVHRSPVLAAYFLHPGLQQRLGKNCRVNLSSGLHYGWAIEGAVGSEFKIDASYLSPNVSIAEGVERATHIYGVSVLVAESVIRICSPAVAAKCRLIDRVIITGSADPIELYVIDLAYDKLKVDSTPALSIPWTSRRRFRVRQFLEAEKAKMWHEEVHLVKLFRDQPDIAAMRVRYTLKFLHVFNMGYQNYIQGEWQVAQRLLSCTRTMLDVEDGPSAALLHYMMTPHNFVAPDSWQGVRVLDQAVLS